MRQTILRLHRELGLTILLSSHLLNEVEQLCTRIAVMDSGQKRCIRRHAGRGDAEGAVVHRLNVQDSQARGGMAELRVW